MPSPAVNDPARNQRIIDVVVQSSTVGLFHAYDIAVAPAPGEMPFDDRSESRMVGVIRFNAKGFEGTMALSIGGETLARFSRTPMGLHATRDLIRELTNQLMGRLKNRLLQFQIVLQVGFPTALVTIPGVRSPTAERTTLRYVFRTRHSPVLVTLEGSFDTRALVFSAAEMVAREGDLLMF